MRKPLVAGISGLALILVGTAAVTGLSLALSGKAFAAGGGVGSTGTAVRGAPSATGASGTTSQRGACPPGEVKIANDTCIRKGQ